MLFGVHLPAKTPVALVRQINADFVHVLEKSELKEKLFAAGVEAIGSSQDEFRAAIKADAARWGKVIREAGIKID